MSPDPATDDSSIEDDDILYRRVLSGGWVKWKDGIAERASSLAFEDNRDGTNCSVVIASVLNSIGGTVQDVLRDAGGRSDIGVAAVRVSAVRAAGLGVERSPLPGQLAHGEITGVKTERRCASRKRRGS